MSSPKEIKQANYLNLLAKDIGETIRKLKKDFPNTSNIYKRTILLKGEWNDLQKKINSGIISTEDRIIQQNKIRTQVLEVIQLIGREDIPVIPAKPTLLGLWLGLIALLLGLGGWFAWTQFNQEEPQIVGKPIIEEPQEVDSIRVGNILYYIPRVMQIGRKNECTIRISNKKVLDTTLKENIAKKRLPETKKEETPIGNVMEVKILPVEKAFFKLDYATNVQQPIIENNYTEWTIYVTPLANINAPGTYKLNLQVSIISKDEKTELVTGWNKWIAKDIEIKVITAQPAEPFPKPWDTAATVVLASQNFADSLTIKELEKEQRKNSVNSKDPSTDNPIDKPNDVQTNKPTTNVPLSDKPNTTTKTNSDTGSKSGTLSGGSSGKGKVGLKLFTRKIIKKPPAITTSLNQTGKIIIEICIDKKGKVISAEYRSNGSTISNTSLRNQAIRNAKQWIFREAKFFKKQQCGKITYEFKRR